VIATTRIETFLPGFGGFHGARWENLFPFSREMCADRFAQEEEADGLHVADFSEILRGTNNASRFFTSLAERFCRRFDAETSGWLGFELGLTFSDLDDRTGPGSTTDHILATMPVRSARRLFEVSAQEQHCEQAFKVNPSTARWINRLACRSASGPHADSQPSDTDMSTARCPTPSSMHSLTHSRGGSALSISDPSRLRNVWSMRFRCRPPTVSWTPSTPSGQR
jgi:hypothetical protein